MASQTPRTAVMRCLRASQTSTRPSIGSQTSCRTIHTLSPLHLEFLAPAWEGTRSIAYTSRRDIGSRSRNNVYQYRTITTAATAATTSPPPPPPTATAPTAAPSTRAIANPRFSDSGEPLLITITPRAAHRLQNIATTDANPNLALRVSVESGGCHGFQYLMSLTSLSEAIEEEDTVFELQSRVGKPGATPSGAESGLEGYRAKVVMDEASLDLLKGSSVDYTMELIGSQFKVVGIPGAKSSCGCGTSFEIALD